MGQFLAFCLMPAAFDLNVDLGKEPSHWPTGHPTGMRKLKCEIFEKLSTLQLDAINQSRDRQQQFIKQQFVKSFMLQQRAAAAATGLPGQTVSLDNLFEPFLRRSPVCCAQCGTHAGSASWPEWPLPGTIPAGCSAAPWLDVAARLHFDYVVITRCTHTAKPRCCCCNLVWLLAFRPCYHAGQGYQAGQTWPNLRSSLANFNCMLAQLEFGIRAAMAN